MNKIWALVKLMRPLNQFQGSIAVLVTATLFETFPPLGNILIGILIVVVYNGAANALNDYCDYEIDCINRPERPLPAGMISRKSALIWAILLFAAGSILGLLYGDPQLILMMMVALILLVTYSLWFKHWPLVGNVVVALILGMAFLFSATLFGDWTKGLPPALLAFGFNFIREIVKDMQDVAGDVAAGARTLPIKYGLKGARNVVVVATALLIVSTVLPYQLNVYGKYYLGVVIFLVDLPLVYVMMAIWRDYSSRRCALLARILKGDVFFGLLAIYLGKF